MSAMADFSASEAGGGTLRFTGDLSLARMGNVPERLNAFAGPVKRLDLSGVGRFDTVGA